MSYFGQWLTHKEYTSTHSGHAVFSQHEFFVEGGTFFKGLEIESNTKFSLSFWIEEITLDEPLNDRQK